MIIRILAEGQFEVADTALPRLNELDAPLQEAVDTGDEAAFAESLTRLLGTVRALGRPLPADLLVGSDLVLPGDDSSLSEVAALIGDDGLIPG